MKFLTLAIIFSTSAFAQREPIAPVSQTNTTQNNIGQINSYCTATMIAPGVAITAAHCLFDHHGDRIAQDEKLYLGRTSTTDFSEEVTITRAKKISASHDIAVFTVTPLPQTASGIPIDALTEEDRTHLVRNDFGAVTLAGYPAGLGDGNTLYEGTSQYPYIGGNDNPSHRIFRHRIQTHPGMSGSAVRAERNGSDNIVAIHASATTSSDIGVGEYLTPEIVEEINRFKRDFELGILQYDLEVGDFPECQSE